jgi:hypothetical protein
MKSVGLKRRHSGFHIRVTDNFEPVYYLVLCNIFLLNCSISSFVHDCSRLNFRIDVVCCIVHFSFHTPFSHSR